MPSLVAGSSYARFSTTDNFRVVMSFVSIIIMSYNDIILAKLRNTRQAASLYYFKALFAQNILKHYNCI